ncbi:MAG: ATP-dependent sacrificial sulfur transferase LarE [Myxococcota bacterium]
MSSPQAKEALLLERLVASDGLLIAYSGGVDSAYLAYAAHRALGDRVLAVTADSPSYPESHRSMAKTVAASVGFAHRFVSTHELENPDYAANPTNRCYFCKTELFRVLERLRRELGYAAVAYGINRDDTGDFRPGHAAAGEHRVLSPLLDAGLGKLEIRELSRDAGLPCADLPASACLSSRIPYGMEVTAEKLRQIDRAEDALRELGFRQLRVRHHGDVARIELAPDEMKGLEPGRQRSMARALHELGFKYVSLDLDGYRMGSLNEGLVIEPAKED